MLTLAQAAALLGLSPSTLRGQVAKGRLRARLIGKTWIVSEREVERYREALDLYKDKSGFIAELKKHSQRQPPTDSAQQERISND